VRVSSLGIKLIRRTPSMRGRREQYRNADNYGGFENHGRPQRNHSQNIIPVRGSAISITAYVYLGHAPGGKRRGADVVISPRRKSDVAPLWAAHGADSVLAGSRRGRHTDASIVSKRQKR
jgi:hypothetical protein